MTLIRTIVLTALALVAFASNSLLCRVALRGGAIDPASFTTIRMSSGALALVVILLVAKRGGVPLTGGWASASLLALYAIAFSFAYVNLSAGTGALVLFAGVQATMMGLALVSGERLRLLEWIGFVIALVGFAALVAPGTQAPSPVAAGLMAMAGIAWGVYSLRGRRNSDSLAETAGNFVRAAPMAVAVSFLTLQTSRASGQGIVLAILSGAIASGVGYVIWYQALRGLSASTASMVQLIVPVLAAIGGIALLSESLSLKMVLSSILILGGVGLALIERTKSRGPRQETTRI